MNFQITNIECYKSPNDLLVDNELKNYKTDSKEIEEVIKNAMFTHKDLTQGFQIDLHNQLKDLFINMFDNKGFNTNTKNIKYSSKVDLRGDVVIEKQGNLKGIYIEIEFRPNEHKDLIKFEIGRKNDIIDLAILVVAMNRENINSTYFTMPEFCKCKELIKEFSPKCPVLLIGIDGKRK